VRDPELHPASPQRAAPVNLLELAIEAFREPLLLIDTAFRVVVANRAARALSPDPKEGTDTLLCCRLLHGRPSPCPETDGRCPLRQAAGGAGRSTTRHEHVRPNGESSVVEITATPLYGPYGQLAGILQVFRDATETERTEEIVSRALNEWLITADSVPDLIFLSDLGGRIMR
jgi:PAS domain-containing protein